MQTNNIGNKGIIDSLYLSKKHVNLIHNKLDFISKLLDENITSIKLNSDTFMKRTMIGKYKEIKEGVINSKQFNYYLDEEQDGINTKYCIIIDNKKLYCTILGDTMTIKDADDIVFKGDFNKLQYKSNYGEVYFTEWNWVGKKSVNEFKIIFRLDYNVKLVRNRLSQLRNDIPLIKEEIRDTDIGNDIKNKYIGEASNLFEGSKKSILNTIFSDIYNMQNVIDSILDDSDHKFNFEDTFSVLPTASGLETSDSGEIKEPWRKNRFVPTEDNYNWFGEKIVIPSNAPDKITNINRDINKFSELMNNRGVFCYNVDEYFSNNNYICAISNGRFFL